jgi:hypothetical protein
MSQIQQSLMPAEVSKSTEIMHTLYADIVNIDELRAFCLGYGVPKKVRAFAWQILLGLCPLSSLANFASYTLPGARRIPAFGGSCSQ